MMNYEQTLEAYFNVYYTQQDAFHHQKSEPDARVFSFEMPSLGRRHFICTQLFKFYNFYKYFKGGRWFYELIQDGYPCRPYFDLEFYKDFNKTLDPLACYEDFVSVCKEVFIETLDIHLDETNFMVLDSTTDQKYSAHVIIHLPNKQLFPSNLALKPLVKMICGRMLDSGKCIVKKKDGSNDFLCDQSVYSKNRNFRMYYSSKVNKQVKLVYANYCKFYSEKAPSEQMFFDTMVIPKDLDEYELVNMEPLNEVCQRNSHQVNTPQSNDSRPNGYQIANNYTQSDDAQILVHGTRASMFVELDNFVLSMLQPICPGVQIRKWELVYYKKNQERRIIYYFFNCRFCYRIWREHQSNNVYWVINFENFGCYQRCFDFECRHFKSHWFLIPYQVEEETKKKAAKVFATFGIQPPPTKHRQVYYEIIVKRDTQQFAPRSSSD